MRPAITARAAANQDKDPRDSPHQAGPPSRQAGPPSRQSRPVPGRGYRDGMRAILGKVLATGVAVALAVAAPMSTSAAATGPGTSRAASASPATPLATAAGPDAPRPAHVIVAGIGGLRWSDISPAVTPTLWRLAGQGSAGSLDVTGISILAAPWTAG